MKQQIHPDLQLTSKVLVQFLQKLIPALPIILEIALSPIPTSKWTLLAKQSHPALLPFHKLQLCVRPTGFIVQPPHALL